MEKIVTNEQSGSEGSSVSGLFGAVLKRDLMLAYRKKSDLFNPLPKARFVSD